jgi:hypothetical protein
VPATDTKERARLLFENTVTVPNLRTRLEALEVRLPYLRTRLEALEVRLPCGHRKVDMDDGYGECVLCKYKNLYEENEKELEAAETKYHELIFEVCSKHPGESRHETARRYIREKETASGETGQAKQALEKEPKP